MGYPVQINNTSIPLRFLMVDGVDHISPRTGLTPTVTIAKNLGGFITPNGAITEVGNGWYQVAPDAVDASVLGLLILHATDPSADPCDEQYNVVNYNPQGATLTSVTQLTTIPTTTYEEMTRSLRLYVPQLPYPLAQQFIRDRYRRILELRPWSGLRSEGEFILNASKQEGTVSITRGTASVVGTGTSFASSDIGRQFKVGTGSPILTILSVNASTQTIVLDRNVSVATGSGLAYRVFDGYVTCPSDFMRFITVVDPLQGWRVRHWVTQDELMSWDPQRNFFSQPYALVDRRYDSTGRVQYEAWPYTTSNRGLVFSYVRRAPDLINSGDTPIWPIRSDIIVKGALADVSLWPGTKDMPNPFFTRTDVWLAFQRQYEDELIDLERQDEDIYLSWYSASSWSSWPFAPLSANFIQSHAI